MLCVCKCVAVKSCCYEDDETKLRAAPPLESELCQNSNHDCSLVSEFVLARAQVIKEEEKKARELKDQGDKRVYDRMMADIDRQVAEV